MAEPEQKYLSVYSWKIGNFLCAKGELSSPLFCIEDLNNSKWFIQVNSPQPSLDDWISCYLVPNDENNEVREIYCLLELIVESSESIIKREFCFRPFENEFKIGCAKFISLRQVAHVLTCSREDTVTFKCQIGREKSYAFSPVEWKATSLVEVFSYSFEHFINKQNPSWEMNKVISFWDCRLTAVMTETQDDIVISIINHTYYECTFVCQVLFLHNDKELFRQRSSHYIYDSTANFPSVKKSVLEKHKLNDGIHSVHFQMCFRMGNVSNMTEFLPSSTSHRFISSRYKDPLTVLQEDLKVMFINQIGCDVKLRVGNEVFSAHKSTLSARSPVFKAMFEQDMVENKIGIVDISDTDAKTLKSFLLFCYSATVDEDLDCERAINLLMIADKYQVVSLKDICSSILVSVLNEENVCEVLEVADLIGSETLKEYSMRIIKSNARKIFSSHNWSECVKNNARLAIEVLQKGYL